MSRQVHSRFSPGDTREINQRPQVLNIRTVSTFERLRKCSNRYWIEVDDIDSAGELRFNAIGLVDGRMVFVTYTMRDDIVGIISARGAKPHEKRKYHEI